MDFKIKEARQLAGISQKELAAQMGISPGTLSGYETGAHDPKSDGLLRIADICGVTVDFLLGRIPQKNPAPSSDDAGRKVTTEEVEAILIDKGFIQPGQDLSDADLRFLISVGKMISAGFAER